MFTNFVLEKNIVLKKEQLKLDFNPPPPPTPTRSVFFGSYLVKDPLWENLGMCWIPFPYRKIALTITLAFHAVKHRSLEMLLNGIFKVSCTLADKISSLISIFVIDNNLFQYFQNMFH